MDCFRRFNSILIAKFLYLNPKTRKGAMLTGCKKSPPLNAWKMTMYGLQIGI